MHRPFLIAGVLIPLCGLSADNASVQELITDQLNHAYVGSNRPPQLDSKQVIHQSNSFLKEREPEMSAEEYALYEKVVALLESNATLAVQLLESMMKGGKEPPSPAFEFILGNAYYSAGQADKAETLYRSAVQRYPNFIRAWNNLGVLYYTAGRFADAIPCFSKSIVLGDHEPLTFGLLAYSLEKQEDYVAAELAFMQAIGGDPVNSDWKEGLLRICIQEKQNARAEALVKTLIKDHPKETRYWLMYANILISENRKMEATVLLQAAAGTKVAGPDELTLLGDLYAEQGLVREANTAYSALQTNSPAAGERRLLSYAQMLISGGKFSEAGNLLATLAQKVSSEGRISFFQARADLLIAEKHWPEARKELDSLLQLSPFDGRALLTVGRTYTAEGDMDRASLAFESAVRVDSTKYLASLELANIELRRRHYTDSVKYLEQALAIEKTTPVEDYLARIKTMVAKDDPSTP